MTFAEQQETTGGCEHQGCTLPKGHRGLHPRRQDAPSTAQPAVDLEAIRRRHPLAFDERWALIPGTANSDINALVAEVASLRRQLTEAEAERESDAELIEGWKRAVASQYAEIESLRRRVAAMLGVVEAARWIEEDGYTFGARLALMDALTELPADVDARSAEHAPRPTQWLDVAHMRDGLGAPDRRTGLTAIERELVGGRLTTGSIAAAHGLPDALWAIRYCQDVPRLLREVLSLRQQLTAGLREALTGLEPKPPADPQAS